MLTKVTVLVVCTSVVALQRARNAAAFTPCPLQLLQVRSTSTSHTEDLGGKELENPHIRTSRKFYARLR
jgi:hypothetical protein